MEFAKLGVYCQFDLFGTECSLYQLNMRFDMPSDAQRMDMIVFLTNEGYENRILMSHDIHTKHRLVKHKYIPNTCQQSKHLKCALCFPHDRLAMADMVMRTFGTTFCQNSS